MSDDLIEVDFGGAEGLPLPLSAAFLAPSYVAWSDGHLDVRVGRSGESGVELRMRAAAAADALLGKCEEGGQVRAAKYSATAPIFLCYVSTLLTLCVVYRGRRNRWCFVSLSLPWG